MKKAELEKRIASLAKEHGVEWVAAGGTKHDKYRLNGVVIMIPRHKEIGEDLAREILKQCKRAVGR